MRFLKQNKLKFSSVFLAINFSLFSVNTHANVGQQKIEEKKEDDIIVVTASKTHHTASSDDVMQKVDINDNAPTGFGDIMRYQTLISVPSVATGTSSTGFDRGGYRGYNIRGLEGNRVALDVNGIPLPEATGRSYASRKAKDTFSIGRDYVDPFMYRELDIEVGSSSANKNNGAIGGSVSFIGKLANDYLDSDNKNFYAGYQGGYDSSNRSLHNGLTLAGKNEQFDGILIISRRDGDKTKINNDISPFPTVWHSNAVLTKGGWKINPNHRLEGTFDYYSRHNREDYAFWKINRNPALNERIQAKQKGDTERYSYDLTHKWTPAFSQFDSVDSRIFYQYTHAEDESVIHSGSPYEEIDSGLDVNLYGFETKSGYLWGNHHLKFGLSGLLSEKERTFKQRNAPNVRGEIMKPEADSRTYRFESFIQNQFVWQLDNNDISVEPGLRLVYQKTQARHLDKMVTNNITQTELETMYGDASSDTFLLPSVLINYQLYDDTYVYAKYQRGVQYPNASQLYGSWNLNQNGLPPTMQYASIGNTDLETETSNAFEVGLKGEVTEGITVGTSVFYNKYKNFIANTRYTRANHPGMFNHVPSHVGVIFKNENRDAAYIYGAEFNTKIKLSTLSDSLSGFSSVLSVGYSKGKSKSSYSGDEYVDLESIAPMKFVFGLNWDSPQEDYGFSVISTFQKGKQAKDSGRESYNNTPASVLAPSVEYFRVPGYGIFDVSGYWQLTKDVRFNGGIRNLMNKRYWDYGSSHTLTNSAVLSDQDNILLSTQSGRTFYISMNIDF